MIPKMIKKTIENETKPKKNETIFWKFISIYWLNNTQCNHQSKKKYYLHGEKSYSQQILNIGSDLILIHQKQINWKKTYKTNTQENTNYIIKTYLNFTTNTKTQNSCTKTMMLQKSSKYTVACIGTRRTGQILWISATWATIAYADVSRLEFTDKRFTWQKTETKARFKRWR